MKNQNENHLALLTPREAEVAGLLAKGMTCPEITEKLHLSIHTVKTHCRNIYLKLGVRNRAELVSDMVISDL